MNIERIKLRLEEIEDLLRNKSTQLNQLPIDVLPITMNAFLNMVANTIEQLRKEIV